MRTLHTASQKEGEADDKKISLKYCGLDLINGKPRNNLRAGVLEPMLSKINSIRFATEAAITILRIDDMIKLAPEQREAPAHWLFDVFYWQKLDCFDFFRFINLVINENIGLYDIEKIIFCFIE